MLNTARRGMALVLTLSAVLGAISTGFPPIAHAAESYKVQAFPFYSQEGSAITIVLTVSSATPSTTYQFDFIVQDPANANCTSTIPHTTGATETEFSIIIGFPGAPFSTSCAPTSLAGGYRVYVNQTKPVLKRNVSPGVVFYVGLVDSLFPYQRTQTVRIQATGYRSGEPAVVAIRTTSTLTLVFTNATSASASGVVNSAWKIPRNATIVESYLVTVSGTVTSKSPSDAQVFFVQAAQMTIPSLTSSRSTYERTETFSFAFQATYPDSSTANTGAALVTLIRPDGTNITLTANYDSASQKFVARYKTFTTNQTGTWTGSLTSNAYDDGNGNTGPATAVSTSPQLQPATLTVSIMSQPSYALNQQIKFNTTIQYPDGSNFQAGSVSSFLAFTGGGGYNDSVPIIYDSTLQLWVGSYTPGVNEPGGLWSLSVVAADSSIPPNPGSATRAVTLQDRPPVSSFTASPTTALTGVTISFDGTASSDPDGTIATYSWDFGDGSTASGSTASHSYSIAGNYTARLTVTDNSGSTASNTALLTIQDRPPTATITGPTGTTVAGQSASFSAAGTVDPDGAISSYAWNFGDGSTGTGLSATHTYSNPGTYTVTLTVTDNSGKIGSTSSTITIGAASSSDGNASFPLYYFGILVAIIAAMLAGGFLYFRRHRVTHAKLKIDLEAVKSEAGRIENQEFFQSVKDQLKKDKDD